MEGFLPALEGWTPHFGVGGWGREDDQGWGMRQEGTAGQAGRAAGFLQAVLTKHRHL